MVTPLSQVQLIFISFADNHDIIAKGEEYSPTLHGQNLLPPTEVQVTFSVLTSKRQELAVSMDGKKVSESAVVIAVQLVAEIKRFENTS